MEVGDSVLYVNITLGGIYIIYEAQIRAIKTSGTKYILNPIKKYVDIRNGEETDTTGMRFPANENQVYKDVNELIKKNGYELIDWIFKVGI